MGPDPQKQDVVQEPVLEEADMKHQDNAPGVSNGDQGEEDVIDHVFSNAERVCCGRFRGKGQSSEEGPDEETGLDCSKNAPVAPETGGERDSEREDGHLTGDERQVSMTEISRVDPPEAAPKSLERNSSSIKEAVEIQAHFEEEDGLTITTDNGQDTTAEAGVFGMFLNENGAKSSIRRQRRKVCMGLLVFVIVCSLVIGLSVGLANKNKRENDQSVSQSLAANGDTATGGSGTEANSVNVDTDGSGADGDTDDNTQVVASPPAASPTEAVAPEITTIPTAAPTACNYISVSSTCYEHLRDEVSPTFNICQAASQDWVSIYPEGSDMDNMEYPDLEWRYTCGDQECDETVGSSTIAMGTTTPPGRYQAYLFSNIDGDQGAPYVAIASSEVFEVTTGTCN